MTLIRLNVCIGLLIHHLTDMGLHVLVSQPALCSNLFGTTVIYNTETFGRVSLEDINLKGDSNGSYKLQFLNSLISRDIIIGTLYMLF